MFNAVVHNTVLTDEIAESFFRNKIIDGGQIGLRGITELSLVATCRALFYPRMDDDEKLLVRSINLQGNNFESNFNAMLFGNASNATLDIIIVDREKIKEVDDLFAGKERWEEIEKVKLFYAQHFPVRCYANSSIRSSLIIAEMPRSSDGVLKCYHALQACLLSANPWFYDTEKDQALITENEIRMMQSFLDGDYDTYQKTLEEFEREVGFREEAILMRLADFEKDVDRQRLRGVEDQITGLSSDIANLMDRLSNKIASRKELQLREQAIRIGIDQKKDCFMIRDYFASNKNAKFIKANDVCLTFAIETYLSDWNQSALRNAIHNRRSVMFDQVPHEYHDIAEKLYEKIFETKEIKVPMTGIFCLEANGRLSAVSGMSSSVKDDSMPNPHLDFYSCLGGYESDIIQAMENEDWAFALEIAYVAAGNVNFEDSTVMYDWTKFIFTKECNMRSCFELPDGSRVTLKKALQYITEQEQKEDEENGKTDKND